jgi:hypothetical protein
MPNLSPKFDFGVENTRPSGPEQPLMSRHSRLFIFQRVTAMK